MSQFYRVQSENSVAIEPGLYCLCPGNLFEDITYREMYPFVRAAYKLPTNTKRTGTPGKPRNPTNINIGTNVTPCRRSQQQEGIE